MRRVLMVVVLGLAGLVAVAAPATADPAGPTHYRATITSIDALDGGAPGVDVEILGGDAFVVVRAEPGTVVEVPGYDGEPYLRIDADGAVHVNQLSPARWLNDERYGAASMEAPPQADAEAPPQWTLAARGGEYAWHDHRVHFMSPALPPQVDPDAVTEQPIWDWSVPMHVDGREITVNGELVWVPGPRPVVPVGLIVVATLLALAVVLQWPAAAPLLVIAASIATGAVSVVKLLDVPAGGDAEPALLVLPAVAIGLLVVGVGLGRREASRGRLIAGAAGIPLLVWGILQSGALTRPIVPGPLPVEAVRGLVTMAFAVGIASVTAGVLAAVTATSVDEATPAPVRD